MELQQEQPKQASVFLAYDPKIDLRPSAAASAAPVVAAAPAASALAQRAEDAGAISNILKRKTPGYTYGDGHGNFYVIEGEKPPDIKWIERERFRSVVKDKARILHFSEEINTAIDKIPKDLPIHIEVVVPEEFPDMPKDKNHYTENDRIAHEMKANIRDSRISVVARPLTGADLAGMMERGAITETTWPFIRDAIQNANVPVRLRATTDLKEAHDLLLKGDPALGEQASAPQRKFYFPAVWDEKSSTDPKTREVVQELYNDLRTVRIHIGVTVEFSDAGVALGGSDHDLKQLAGKHFQLHFGKDGSQVQDITVRENNGRYVLAYTNPQGQQTDLDNLKSINAITGSSSFSIHLPIVGQNDLVLATGHKVLGGFRTAHVLSDAAQTLMEDEKIATSIRRHMNDKTDAAFETAILHDMKRDGPRGKPFSAEEKKLMGAIHQFVQDGNLEKMCDAMGLQTNEKSFSQKNLADALDLMAPMDAEGRQLLRQALQPDEKGHYGLADKDHYITCGPAQEIGKFLKMLGYDYAPQAIDEVVERKDAKSQEQGLSDENVARWADMTDAQRQAIRSAKD